MSSKHSVDPADFRRACAQFATGVTIAGVRDASGNPHGLTVNSFTSVSLEPPLLLVSIGHQASVLACFRQATHFGVSILDEEQRGLSDRFARKGADRFDGVAWHPGETGVPLIDGVLTTFECSLYRRVEAGDHDLFLGEALHLKTRPGRPLLYFASQYRALA